MFFLNICKFLLKDFAASSWIIIIAKSLHEKLEKSWKWSPIIHLCRWKIVQLFIKKDKTMCVLFQAKKLSNIFFRFQLRSVAKYEKEFCKTSFKCSAHPSLAKSISYFCPSLKTPLASIIIKHTSHQWKLFFVRKCKARQLPFESLPQNVKAYLGKKISNGHESHESDHQLSMFAAERSFNYLEKNWSVCFSLLQD